MTAFVHFQEIRFPIFYYPVYVIKGNNKITEFRTILQRESQNS